MPKKNNEIKTITDTNKSDLASVFENLVNKYKNAVSAANMAKSWLGAGERAIGISLDPTIQNRRIKSISSLPNDVTKNDVGAYLRLPYENEKNLRGTSQTLRWTNYPYYKIIKTYADIPTYRYYVSPKNVKDKSVLQEETRIIENYNDLLRIRELAHTITGQALALGKVFYIIRDSKNTKTGEYETAYFQQLPEDYCRIAGYNNITKYTVAFDMTYFMQPGTNYKDYGTLFDRYYNDFKETIIDAPKEKYGYIINEQKVNSKLIGTPEAKLLNGVWHYWIYLDPKEVFVFEIDDTLPIVAPTLSGLMLTYAQQSDYENAQISLILNPLVKIFTGTIETRKDDVSAKEDMFKISPETRELYEILFDNLMGNNNTGGTAFYSAPFTDIKSHNFESAANANDISSSFNRYGIEKAGLSGILPASSDPKAGIAEMSGRLEGEYSSRPIYACFKRTMEYIYSQMGLKNEFNFTMFGTIYNEDKIREAAEKGLARGDLSQYYILAALNDTTILRQKAMAETIKDSGYLDLLEPPKTSSTLSKQDVGRPQTTIEDIKQGKGGESTEKKVSA